MEGLEEGGLRDRWEESVAGRSEASGGRQTVDLENGIFRSRTTGGLGSVGGGLACRLRGCAEPLRSARCHRKDGSFLRAGRKDPRAIPKGGARRFQSWRAVRV